MRIQDKAHYRMGDGVLYVHERVEDPADGKPPFKPIAGGGKFFFEELSIRSEDYEAAKGERAKLTARVRILRPPHVKINSLHFVKMNGTLYSIWKINGTINRQGVHVYDITLAASTEVSE